MHVLLLKRKRKRLWWLNSTWCVSESTQPPHVYNCSPAVLPLSGRFHHPDMIQLVDCLKEERRGHISNVAEATGSRISEGRATDSAEPPTHASWLGTRTTGHTPPRWRSSKTPDLNDRRTRWCLRCWKLPWLLLVFLYPDLLFKLCVGHMFNCYVCALATQCFTIWSHDP